MIQNLQIKPAYTNANYNFQVLVDLSKIIVDRSDIQDQCSAQNSKKRILIRTAQKFRRPSTTTESGFGFIQDALMK
jgi:hypothetical protein